MIRRIMFMVTASSGWEALCSVEQLLPMYAPADCYRPKNMPLAEEYEADELNNDLISKDVFTYGNNSVSEDRFVFKKRVTISHPVFEIP